MATIEKQVFASMVDESLIFACIEPVIIKVRGKDLAAKMEVYSHLNEAQRALFMFQILYGHASRGVAGVFNELSYLLAIPAVWQDLKESLLFFKADAMVTLLGEIEQIYHAHARNAEDGLDAAGPQLAGYDAVFGASLEQAVHQIAAFIRVNPGSFLFSPAE